MRKTISHLESTGPSTPDEMPYSIGPADKMQGARVFKLTSATKTKIGGMVTPVYYIESTHSREMVLREFLRANPQLVETLPQQSLNRMIGEHGDSWRNIVSDVTDEFYGTESRLSNAA